MKKRRFSDSYILAPLTAAAFIFALVWLVIVPPFHGPDEVGHFLYVQAIVDKKEIPWTAVTPQNKKSNQSKSEDYLAVSVTGLGMIAGNPAGKVPEQGLRDQQWDETQKQIPSRQRVLYESSTFKNPPLYYLTQAPAYWLTKNQSIFTRAFTLRAFNLIFLALYLLVTWLLAKELFKSTLARVTLTSLVAFQPQVSHLATIVNPDILFSVLATYFTLLSVRVLKCGLQSKRIIGLLLTSVALAFCHIRGIPFPAIAIAILLYRWKMQSNSEKETKRRGFLFRGFLLSSFLVSVAVSAEFSLDRVRGLGSYLWRFYLPDLPGMSTKFGGKWDVQDAFIDRFFGTFGYLDVVLSKQTLSYIAVGTLLYLLFILVTVFAFHKEVAKKKQLIIPLVTLTIFYILSIHFAAYRTFDTSSDPVLTGRYLLPILPILSAGVVGQVFLLPKKWQPVITTTLMFLVVFLQFFTLGTAIDRYYI